MSSSSFSYYLVRLRWLGRDQSFLMFVNLRWRCLDALPVECLARLPGTGPGETAVSMGLPLDWVASGLGQNCGHKGHAASSLGTSWGFLSALWHLVVLASSGGKHGPLRLLENLSHSCDCFGCPHLTGSTLPIPTFLRMSLFFFWGFITRCVILFFKRLSVLM